MLRDQAPKPRRGGVQRARALRKTMTLPEVLLWRALQARPGGLKFRKQHPSGPFTLDFYCIDARLVVEVDGEAHSRGEQPVRDEARDAWFARFGLETLRVPAVEILRDFDGVLRGIAHVATLRLPLHHPASPDGPPPRDKLGEN
jgi:very-short-patch-repair endonuclease